mgnify:FL=1
MFAVASIRPALAKGSAKGSAGKIRSVTSDARRAVPTLSPISEAKLSEPVDASALAYGLSRRDVLHAGLAAAFAAAAAPSPALAAYGAATGSDEVVESGPVTFSTFYGAAAPPATYGTLGGTTKDKAKYSYEVPSNWKEEAPTKVEKGAGGQDSRFVLIGSRGFTKCYCLTLNRAGEDGAAFDLTDKALNAIAGADSKLQEAITTGKVTSKKSSADGQDYTTYGVTQSTVPGEFAIKITVDNTGRLFAFVLTAPERTYEQERKNFTRIVDSFRTYNSVSQFV